VRWMASVTVALVLSLSLPVPLFDAQQARPGKRDPRQTAAKTDRSTPNQRAVTREPLNNSIIPPSPPKCRWTRSGSSCFCVPSISPHHFLYRAPLSLSATD
jgi:hypothetical protein